MRIASNAGEEINARLSQLANVDIVPIHHESLKAWPPDAQALVMAPRFSTGQVWPKLKPAGWPNQIKWVQLISVGLDSYPSWLLECPMITKPTGSSADSIAEYVLASIFSVAKEIPDIWIKKPEDWKPHALAQMRDRHLGIMGFGGIGQAIARLALGVGMRVSAARRRNIPISTMGVVGVSDIAELFRQCTDVVIATPLTDETDGLIDEDMLRGAKQGLHLINIARGKIIHEQALLNALNSGIISFATLDATSPEPLPAGHVFYSHPRVRVSPHTSAYASGSHQNLTEIICENIRRYLNGQPLLHVVDPVLKY